MSIDIIRERLATYRCKDDREEAQAIREITQEIVLGALSRAEFFKYAAFHGGTCLRIMHGLNRFSEDLDFVLRRPDPTFRWAPFLDGMKAELAAFGYDAELKDKPQEDKVVRKAIIKDATLVKGLQLHYLGKSGVPGKINIRMEVDTNPPADAGFENRYLSFPRVAPITTQDEGTLFAGKLHALLCRDHVKGRDWYDFIWYASRKSPVNPAHLTAAIRQQGPWSGSEVAADHAWVRTQLASRIESLDWKAVRDDVIDFVRREELDSVRHWGKDLFLSLLEGLKSQQFEDYRVSRE